MDKEAEAIDTGLFGVGYDDWDADMRAILGDEAWEDALDQCEIDMRDATVSAPAGLHW